MYSCSFSLFRPFDLFDNPAQIRCFDAQYCFLWDIGNKSAQKIPVLIAGTGRQSFIKRHYTSLSSLRPFMMHPPPPLPMPGDSVEVCRRSIIAGFIENQTQMKRLETPCFQVRSELLPDKPELCHRMPSYSIERALQLPSSFSNSPYLVK